MSLLLFLLVGGAQSLRTYQTLGTTGLIWRPLWEFPNGGNNASQCGIYKQEDLSKPIAQVKRENPGIHMYCYFDGASNTDESGSWKGNWLSWTSHPPPADPNQFPFKMPGYTQRPSCQPLGTGPLKTQLYEGKNVSTHADCFEYQIDDIMFYAIGWMQNMLDGSALKAGNWTAWEELAERECQKLQDEFQFTEEEITVEHLTLFNGPDMCAPSLASWEGGMYAIHVPRREYARHAYEKCVMEQGAWEMAFGYNGRCLLPGNMIGHGPECEPGGYQPPVQVVAPPDYQAPVAANPLVYAPEEGKKGKAKKGKKGKKGKAKRHA
jgi:hypothetical protein